MRPRSCLLVSACVASMARPALAASGSHVGAELVSDVSSIRAGEPFWVGLHLRMAPEWHTYWKNPGDAGLPTRLTWRLPQGFSAGPIQWPRPQRFGRPPVVSYGYSDDVLLMVRIQPPASLASGPVSLGVRADWLECKDVCLPGRAELKLSLEARADAPRPAPSWVPVFERARRQWPQQEGAVQAELDESGNRVGLRLTVPRGWGSLDDAYFYPDAKDVLDHAAPQGLTRVGRAYRLQLTPAPNASRPLAGLSGVLETHTSDGRSRSVSVTPRPAASAKPTGGGPPPAKEDRR